MQVSGLPTLRNLASIGLGWGLERCSVSKCPLVLWMQAAQGCTWRNLLRGPHYQPTLLCVRPSSLLNQQYDSCLSLPWIRIKEWHTGACHAGCDSHGITPHHSMCCQLPLLLLPPTPSFPLSLPSCHHQLPLHLLPLTLQG